LNARTSSRAATARALEDRLLERPESADWWVYADWLAEHSDPWAPVVLAGLRGQHDLSAYGLGEDGIRRLGPWARPHDTRTPVALRWRDGLHVDLDREGRASATAAPTRFRLLHASHVRARLDELPPLPPATSSLRLFVSSAPSVRALAGLDLRRLELSASLGQLDLAALASVGSLHHLGLDAFTVSLEPLAEVALTELKLGPRVRASLEPLQRLPDLRHLTLHHFQGYLEPVADLSDLTTLAITYGKRCRDLTPLFGLPGVRTLLVRGSGAHLAAGLPALDRLEITDGDVSFEALARCPTLRHLRIAERGPPTLEGIERLPALEVLEVEGTELHDVSAVARAGRLRVLRLVRCPFVERAAVDGLGDVEVELVD